MERQLIFALGVVCGALCLAAGVSYLFVEPTQLTISLLVVLGVVGCFILVAAGAWQRVSADRFRSLLSIAVVGLLFAFASGLGVAGARFAQSVRLEPTGLPVVLHVAGVVAGVALGVVALGEVAVIVRRRGGGPLRADGDPVR